MCEVARVNCPTLVRLIGCIRVSRVAGREGESFISPQQQRDRIEAHAAAHGHAMIGWQEDLDQPGSRMDRPGLEQALQAIERGDADGIAVAKLDRFARSVAGAARALERLEQAGGVLVAVDLGMDTSTPAGKLMRNVLMALAEFELDRIRENWRDADRRAVNRGVHIASRVVPGYRRGEGGRLEIDEPAAEVIRDVFRARGRGETWANVLRMLDERLPRPDGGRWPLSTVQSLLGRRTYLGEASHGAVVNPDAHDPIVTVEEWQAAQPSEVRPPVRHGALLLAGLIRCAGCGYPMTAHHGGRRGYENYKCRIRHAAGTCPAPARISVPRADGYVTDRFLNLAGSAAARDHDLTVEVERAIAELENADAELTAYRDTELVSVIGSDRYRAGLEQRVRRVDEARDVLGRLRRRSTPLGLLNVAGEWELLDLEQRRALLHAAVDAVFVRRAHLPGQSPFEDRLHICWAGDGPAGLPGRRRSVLRPFVFPDD